MKIERDVILTDMKASHDPHKRLTMTVAIEGLGLRGVQLDLPLAEMRELLDAFHGASQPAFRVTLELVDAHDKKRLSSP